MNRTGIMSALFLMTLAGVVSPVFAGGNPHTIGAPTVTIDDNGTLIVDWKVAGLGSFTSAAFLTADSVEATWACVNPGVGDGKHVPPGQPLIAVMVTGPSTTIPGGNGQRTFTVTISIPPELVPDPGTFCPNPNWSVALQIVTYVNVVLHIQQVQDGVVVEVLTETVLPGTFSRTFPDP